MAEFKFSNADALWFNPLTDEGSEIFLERDTADDKAQVDLGFIQTTGARLKFNNAFDKTPRIIFSPGEFKKSINLTGIVSILNTPNSIKLRINNVSEGDSYTRPSEINIKLVNKTPPKRKETVNMAATTNTAISTTTESKIEKLLTAQSAEMKKITARLTALEGQAKDDVVRDEATISSLEAVDMETSEILAEIEKLKAKISGTGSMPTNSPTSASTVNTVNAATSAGIDSSTAASISQIVLEILKQTGIVPATPASTTATLTYEGKTYKVAMPTNKPVCDPIVTTNTVVTPVEPEFQLVYKPCVPMPTVSPCGTYMAPVMATLENGWKNTVDVQPFPNNYEKTGYYKHDNRIYLMGNLTGGSDQLETSNKTKRLFTIPPSCAPKTQQSFTVAGRTTNGGIEAVELIIYPNSDGSATVYAQNEGIMPQTIAIVGNYLLAT